jgi:murein DD-endopeptidase MepM/ murein hydrolase activator NlpD
LHPVKDIAMTKPDSNRTFHGFSSQRSLLISSLGWLGGISLLGTGIAYAQTASTETSPIAVESSAVPSAQDLFQPDAQDSPEALSAPAAPEAIVPTLEPPASAIAPVAPEQSGDALDAIGTSPAPSNSAANSPAPDSLASDSPAISPNLVDNAKPAFGQASASGAYIDPTPYSLGATSPDVILSERSTGCQAVLQPGQRVPDSICPPAATVATAYAGGESAGSGGYDGGYSNTSITLPSIENFYNLTVRPPAKLSNGNVSLMFPLTIPAVITSVFGWRIHPIAGESRFHSGTDIGAPQGTPVVAAFGGKVQISDLMGGYGLAVVLRHDSDTEETLYGHMSEVFVKPGDSVKQGDVIGRVGSTGYSTGPHLHFEFRQLTPQGWMVLDPGQALEYSLAQLIKGIKPGQDNSKSLFASISWKGFKKALEMAEAKPRSTAAISQIKPQLKPDESRLSQPNRGL